MKGLISGTGSNGNNFSTTAINMGVIDSSTRLIGHPFRWSVPC